LNLINKSINNLSDRLNKLYPDTSSSNNYNDGINYWKGKKIVSLDEWRKIAKSKEAIAHGIQYQRTEEALQYFPSDYIQMPFPFGVQDSLEETANTWYSDYLELMEYRRNPNYGKTKCFQCLLSPDREEAAIFIGINKVMSRALDSDDNTSSIYPCPVLNRFACPYEKKKSGNKINDDGNKLDVNYLFSLSEIAFAVELALAKAEDEQSKVRIKSVEDVYHALTDKDTLEKILQQGLKEEHKQYKDQIEEFFMNMKDTLLAVLLHQSIVCH
jgi:hypothetical protein